MRLCALLGWHEPVCVVADSSASTRDWELPRLAGWDNASAPRTCAKCLRRIEHGKALILTDSAGGRVYLHNQQCVNDVRTLLRETGGAWRF